MSNLIFNDNGITVRSNENGLYNLNDLHKLSGGEANKSPSQWLRLNETKELIEECENLTMHMCIVKNNKSVIEVKEGRYGGTYTHELLLVSYAGWVSTKFQLYINQVFLNSERECIAQLEKEKAQLIEFKDDIYRRGIINGSLPPNTSGTPQRVLKAIQYILNSFRFKKEVKYEDIARYSINHHHHKDFNEAWDYVERNKLLETRYPNRNRYDNWYTIRIK